MCLAVRNAPPPALPNPWAWPSRPWESVHLDFAGPFQGSMFLITVDAYAKLPEVYVMPNTTVPRTPDSLRQMFAAYGLPSQTVTDNGPQFNPASNGLAECFIQSFKQSMKAMVKDGLPLNLYVSDFLLTYRSTPHATTGVAPCTLFLKHQICTRFDLL